MQCVCFVQVICIILKNIANGENTTRSFVKEHPLSAVLYKTALRMLKKFQTTVSY